MWDDILHDVLAVDVLVVLDRVEAYDMCVQPLRYLPLYAVERSAADKEYVACVDVYIVLVGVFPPAFWWDIYCCSLKEFQQSLLHALARHVACDARVVALACYLVYLVDEDYSPLCCLKVIVGHLQQA